MFPLFWKVISPILNSFEVLNVTCDGASPTHKFFEKQFPMTNVNGMNPDVGGTCKTIDLFNKEK